MFSVKSISHVDFPFYCVYSYFLIFVQLWLSFKHETTAPKVSCRQRSHPIFFFFLRSTLTCFSNFSDHLLQQ